MSGLQNFVKGNRNGRPESPQNGQLKINPQRASVAANLKLPMKPEIARPPTGQGVRGRDESIAARQAASSQQQQLPQAQSGESRKRDPYDTDAESLDTTVNRSILEVENAQELDRQRILSDNEEHEFSEEEEEDEASGEEGSEAEEDFPVHVQQYLGDHGKENASRDEQWQFIHETQPHILAPIDGDSYPPTTDGIPTEVDEQQEQPREDPGLPSPSSQRFSAPSPNAQMSFQQHQHRSPGPLHANPVVRQNSKIYRQGAQIRGQQRLEGAAQVGASAQQHATFEPASSQPPTHSQANQEYAFVVRPTTLTWPTAISQGAHNSGFMPQSSRLPPISGHAQNPVPRIVEPMGISTYAPAPLANALPVIQQSVEPVSVEEHVECLGDYDQEVLAGMEYDELINEEFDKDPREQESVLPDNIRGQALPERLQFAQQALHPDNQAKFFGALPTDEWEEAGDWFLEQFTAVLTRTKEARTKKRKQAQAFEKKIEGRHRHIVKKQRLVQDAMAKMQAQGEGLVPKSPRASKSPRPRRI